MQNKCNCGCQQGFVPVNGNWDFNMDGNCGCQQGYPRRTRRNTCGEYEQTYARTRDNDDCQCERCDNSREAECCEKNTYIRDMGEEDCGGSRTRSACSGKADCQCETCTRNRARSRRGNTCDECKGDTDYNRGRSNGCGCDKDDRAYNRGRSDGCGCDKDNGSTYARTSKNRTVGMINVEMQEIDEIFESESALRAGTLFPELHKPMNGYYPCDENCGTCKQAAAFAAWEMRLYLNTHPNDKEALALFRKLCKEAEEENYATTFLTDECCMSNWNWVKNPWPWEYDCQCRSGSDCGD